MPFRRKTTIGVVSLALWGVYRLAGLSSLIPNAWGFPRTTYRSRVESKCTATQGTTALCLFRPDWMRRAGRIEAKRKERRAIFESLRKRQRDLGIDVDPQEQNKRQPPQRYRVVSKDGPNAKDSASDGSSLLKIYLTVPENEIEEQDESNVMDHLKDGEIVTELQRKILPSSAPPVRTAVLAATLIYNIESPVRYSQMDVPWIEHDKGGWSPVFVDGVRRLVPIDDDEAIAPR